MIVFVSGLLVMGYAAAALLFLKFWRATHDRLFALFSLAFLLLAVQRAALAAAVAAGVDTTWHYVLRLLAFVIILAAIVDKNRSPSA